MGNGGGGVAQLYAGGKASSVRDALALAQEALSSGAAKNKLAELAQS